MPKKDITPKKKPGRKPENLKAFDDRTMLRMFKTEHEAWRDGAKALSEKLGVRVSVGTFIRIAGAKLCKTLGIEVAE